MPPELVVEPGPSPPPAPPPRCSYGRAALTATGALICAVPYAIALALEEGLRALTGQGGTYRVRAAGWSFLTLMYDALIALASKTSAYRSLVWRWPEGEFSTRNRIVLTFDDAPGDNPAILEELLDVLKEFRARASFFCTTNLIAGMEKLMERIVADGHEVCNHMPEDRPYLLFSEEAFAAQLRSAPLVKKFASRVPHLKNYIYFERSPPSFFFRAKRGELFFVIATQEPFAPKARRKFLFKNSIPKLRKILYVKLHFSLLQIQFFGFGPNFRKMEARI